MSTVHFIAAERTLERNAKFKKLRAQRGDSTRRDRKVLLDYLSKLSNRVSGRDRFVLERVGSY